MNNVNIIGRLTKDIELMTTKSGNSVVSFTIAVDNPTRQGEEKSASFFGCTAWNKVAETMAKYCHKGDKVAVSGRLNQRKYNDEQGQSRSVVEIVVQSVEFMTRSDKTAQRASEGPSQPSQPAALEADDLKSAPSDDDLPF